MISLDAIGGHGPYYVNYLLINSTDVPVVILIVICLFIAYSKSRKTNLNKNESIIQHSNEPMTLEYRDVLMQPIKETVLNDGKMAFTNFPLTKLYNFLGIFAIIIFISVLIIFNETI